MARTITAANSVFMLSVAGVFNVPQQIQGYTADAAFAVDSVELSQAIVGVDGLMSAGYVTYLVPQTINIMPDSPSLVIFEAWVNAMNTARDVFFASGIVVLPAIGRKFTLNKGVLTNAKPFADVKKTLQPLEYKISWESVSASPI